MNPILIIGALLLGTIILSGCTMGNMADGIATDSIARVSYGGWIWKTWRAEFTNDHPTSDGSGGTIPQRYGLINDGTLIQKAQDCAASGKRVKLYYKSNFIVWDWDYSDPEVIYKIEGGC